MARHADAIAHKLDDSDADVRYAAIEMLGELEPMKIALHAVAIARKLEDPDTDVRRVAEQALGKLARAERRRRTKDHGH